MGKVYSSAAEAVADIPDGASLAVGGFGLCGIPMRAHRAPLRARAPPTCSVVSNNCGVDDWGLGVLLCAPADRPDDQLLRRREQGVRPPVPRRRARGRARAPRHPRRAAARRRLRHPRLLTPPPASARSSPRAGCPGATTADGTVAVASPPRRSASRSDGRRLRPRGGDRLRLRLVRALRRATGTATSSSTESPATSTRSCAMAGRVTIAEVEQLVEPGEIDPDAGPPARGLRPARRRGRPDAEKRHRAADHPAPGCGGREDGAEPLTADGGPGGARAARRRVRQPRASACRRSIPDHLPPAVSRLSSSPRTASSASGPTRSTTARRTPTSSTPARRRSRSCPGASFFDSALSLRR